MATEAHEDGLRFEADTLKRFAEGVYLKIGVASDAASLLADSLVQADLWGW